MFKKTKISLLAVVCFTQFGAPLTLKLCLMWQRQEARIWSTM